jgi:hypothetical protein
VTAANSVAPFYDGWRYAQERLVERISELKPQELRLQAAPHLSPIYAWSQGVLHLDQPHGNPLGIGVTAEEYGKAGIRTRGAETPAQALSRRSHSTTLPPPRGGGSQFTLSG